MYQIANEAQDFQYKRKIYPSVWFGNMEIDETTDQEIANLYQQVFKEDPEHLLARGHFKWRSVGEDTTMPYRRKY